MSSLHRHTYILNTDYSVGMVVAVVVVVAVELGEAVAVVAMLAVVEVMAVEVGEVVAVVVVVLQL